MLVMPFALAVSISHAQQDSFPLPPREWPSPVMDQQPFTFLLLDQLEYRSKNGKDAVGWNAEGWFGGDHNKLWLKSEGEADVRGSTRNADVQALFARRISPYWYLQGGVRNEIRPGSPQNSAVLAIEGLAPYWFNVDASLFFRAGDVAGRLEAEYDQLLTQRLILQPRMEANFSGSSDPARGTGNGITDVAASLRLRYEITREFAPYIGVTWKRQLGETADLARGRGEDVNETAFVAGIRVWF